MSVTGSKEDLIAFRDKANAPHTTYWLSPMWVKNEKGENITVPENERTIVEEEQKSDLSFWNFIRPADEDLPYYFGTKTDPKPKGYDKWDAEKKMAHNLKFSGRGWYDWNIREWGTKWDAGDVDLTDSTENKSPDLYYTFQTAWSIPEPVFRAMVEQHPELNFDFSSEEEQGWGASFESASTDEGKTLVLTSEWDIPACHADYVERDREDSCVCGWDEDEENWFSDCPRQEQDFYVVVTKTYRVRTHTAENAWELAQDNNPDEQMELLEDETHTEVRNENGERLYPTLSDGEPELKECQHKFVPHSKMVDGVETVIGTVCVFCHTELALDTATASV